MLCFVEHYFFGGPCIGKVWVPLHQRKNTYYFLKIFKKEHHYCLRPSGCCKNCKTAKSQSFFFRKIITYLSQDLIEESQNDLGFQKQVLATLFLTDCCSQKLDLATLTLTASANPSCSRNGDFRIRQWSWNSPKNLFDMSNVVVVVVVAVVVVVEVLFPSQQERIFSGTSYERQRQTWSKRGNGKRN